MKFNYSQKDGAKKGISVSPVYVKTVRKLQVAPVQRTGECGGPTLTTHCQCRGCDANQDYPSVHKVHQR